MLLLFACAFPQGANATKIDLLHNACVANVPDGASPSAIANAAYACGDATPERHHEWLWLRLDHDRLNGLAPGWHLLVDQTRFDKISVLVVDGQGTHRSTWSANDLGDNWAPGGLLSFPVASAGSDTRALYLGFRKLDTLSLMRKVLAVSPATAVRDDSRWLILMGLFTGALLSALLYNAVIHAGQRYAFQRWYLLWITAALAYGLTWTNMAAFVIPGMVGPTAVRLDFTLVGLMVAAGNMFFFAVIERGMLPRPMIIAGRMLALTGAILGPMAAAEMWFPPLLTDRMLNYSIAATGVTVALSCWIAVRRGSRVVWFYMIGWGPVICVFLARLARNLGFAPQNDFVDMATFAALAFEGLILSLAIADRFRLLRQELELSRQRREIVQAEANALRVAARTDFLTGLSNRAAFKDEAQELIFARTPFTLFLVDVDYLKHTNDRVGHAGGDRLLSEIARLLSAIIARIPRGHVARIGGDEFVILCPGGEACETVLAREIAQMQGASWQFLGQERTISLSVGSARFPEDATTLDLLYQNADLALYNAKRLGRMRYYRYDPLQRALRDLQVEFSNDARVALDRGEFALHMQPLVTLSSGAICGYEALLRWDHPEHGMITPERFGDVLVAEKIGLQIQERVLDLALAWINRHGPAIGTLSVNFTAAQLVGRQAADRVIERLRHHKVPPSLLCIEVTEGVMLDRGADSILANLRTLHDAGIAIALDDFGTGYASLVHLRRMPVDRIKIDRSFIASIDERDGGTLAIVRAIIGMGRGLGKVVVAEGIETEAQAHRLRLLGCHVGQGFYYARPAPDPVVQQEPAPAPAAPKLIAEPADARQLRRMIIADR
ncbi:EAL domain-containing protein [Sphingomonas sp.]|jgi:diguanylate cyclase (GGDEF)-like protein|uniref:putative bifunctional diguanylate cyclase/phosphodiesterase n=1 Tax=Sphingomonas sp. TaxID=28214 RepID=UPI00261E0DF9|nr:EAL domain-containing protein [Sphingomonas sp.]MDF2495872.1 hypothetical protein [Sphingomonas sp.]